MMEHPTLGMVPVAYKFSLATKFPANGFYDVQYICPFRIERREGIFSRSGFYSVEFTESQWRRWVSKHEHRLPVYYMDLHREEGTPSPVPDYLRHGYKKPNWGDRGGD
jgi:hypothetical protein